MLDLQLLSNVAATVLVVQDFHVFVRFSEFDVRPYVLTMETMHSPTSQGTYPLGVMP